MYLRICVLQIGVSEKYNIFFILSISTYGKFEGKMESKYTRGKFNSNLSSPFTQYICRIFYRNFYKKKSTHVNLSKLKS